MTTPVWVGDQGGPPQNVPQWHMDYFELKVLKKQSMPEEQTDPQFCVPESRRWIYHLISWCRRLRVTLTAKDERGYQEDYRNKLCVFFNLLPKPRFCLDSSLIGQPKPKCLSPVHFLTDVLTVRPKTIKAACFAHLFLRHLHRRELRCVSFFVIKWLCVQPQKFKKDRGWRFLFFNRHKRFM